ncbi:MAG: phosphatidylglycerol lysyltransferase domain-containing protein, partial [Syntrophothermus sp.]
MFFKENKKIIIQAIFGILFIGLAYFFIRYQRAEIIRVKQILGNADISWLLLGMMLTLVFISFQGLTYSQSFRTINEPIPFMTGTKVFLKRFFVSVFVPAGSVASLGFFTRDFERKHVPLTKTYFGSLIYGMTSGISLVLVAIPTLIWSLVRRNVFSNQIWSLVILVLVIGLLVFLTRSLFTKGVIYRLIMRVWPAMDKYLSEIRSIKPRKLPYVTTLLAAMGVEITGIFHLAVAMLALGFPVSFEAAILGYITAMLFQIISPFMRGLGAIELSLAFVLSRYGFSTVDAISVTLLYRFFAFWLPLVISGLSFGFIRNKLLLRLVPVLLSFLMGLVNIVSVLTPALSEKLVSLRPYIPSEFFEYWGFFLMIGGLLLLINSAFLLKGLRTAWFIAIIVTVFSLAAHLFLALNYPEAMLAMVLVGSLFFTRRQYFVRGNPLFGQISVTTGLLAVLAVMIYGIIGFYFLDERHFNEDFSLGQSIRHTMMYFFLSKGDTLIPASGYARDFVATIKVAGFLSLAFLTFTLIRPVIFRFRKDDEERIKARELILKYGHSAFDHYKTSQGKYLYFLHGKKAFLSYKVAGNYAIVLEDPVAPARELMIQCIGDFQSFCFDNGLKNFYYLVPEKSLRMYEENKKKHFLVAQEAIVDLHEFNEENLQQETRKAPLNGYSVKLYPPPLPEEILQQVHSVSDEWLKEKGRKEIHFTQGSFVLDELRKQTVMVMYNKKGNIIAFLNIIPGCSSDEAKFDLLRCRKDV